MKKIAVLIIPALLILSACGEKTPPGGDPDQPLLFQALTIEKDTIEAGETTLVTAVAKGYMLTYYWSSTIGDILGSGAQVTYAPSPCQVGINQISCRVQDGNEQSETKTAVIVVQ